MIFFLGFSNECWFNITPNSSLQAELQAQTLTYPCPLRKHGGELMALLKSLLFL